MPLIENLPDAKSTVDGADFLNNYSWWFRSNDEDVQILLRPQAPCQLQWHSGVMGAFRVS